jgi:hypothetical protein
VGCTYDYNTTIQQKCILIKHAIPSDANSDQAPIISTLKEVLDCIIPHLSFAFTVDILAIFKFGTPILNSHKTKSYYFSFLIIGVLAAPRRIFV